MIKKVISAVLVTVIVSGCSSKSVHEDPYMPKKEVVLERTNTPIVKVWDRWNETDSHALQVNGNEVVQNFDLERILANDPDPKVITKLEHAKTWNTIGGIGALIATVGLVWGIALQTSQRQEPYSTSAQIFPWEIFGVGLTGAVIGMINTNSCLDEARLIHNGRVLSIQAKVGF